MKVPVMKFETPEGSLYHDGRKIEHIEGDLYGVVGEQQRFTLQEVINAIMARSLLFAQTGIPETQGKTVTPEITKLLRAQEIIRTTGSNESLFVEIA